MNYTQSTSTKSTIISSVRRAIKNSERFKIKSLYLSTLSNTYLIISTYDGSNSNYDFCSAISTVFVCFTTGYGWTFLDLNSCSTSYSVLALLA